MTSPPERPQHRADFLDWPAQWGRDERFWREVATRTLAGLLTLILLGGPSIIYLMIAGQLSTEVVVPILIGIGLVLFLIVAWWIVRKIARRVEKGRLREAVEKDPSVGSDATKLSPSDLRRLVDEFLEKRRERGDPFGEELEASMRPKSEGLAKLSDETRAHMNRIERASTIWAAAITGLVTLVAGVVAALVVR